MSKHPIQALREAARKERREPRVSRPAEPEPTYTKAQIVDLKLGPVERLRLAKAGRIREEEKLSPDQIVMRKEIVGGTS